MRLYSTFSFEEAFFEIWLHVLQLDAKITNNRNNETSNMPNYIHDHLCDVTSSKSKFRRTPLWQLVVVDIVYDDLR
jgi:hypothetical protein